MKRRKQQIKVGCCGFRSPQREYAEFLSMVEVQHTFYQPPQIKTLQRWRAALPASFEFTLKAWQLITHESRSPTYRRLKKPLSEQELMMCGAFKPNPVVLGAWQVTSACAEALAAKCILFQCPASFTPTPTNIANLREFIRQIDRKNFHLLWEPRGDWPKQIVLDLCRELDLVHVVDPFADRSVTPDFCYFRLHGRGGFRYQYQDEELQEIYEMLPGNKPAYLLFNNVKMIEDAIRFQQLFLKK